MEQETSKLKEPSDLEAWTKDELTIYKNPVAALSYAVLKQWVLDGKPEASKKTISAWKQIFQEALNANI